MNQPDNAHSEGEGNDFLYPGQRSSLIATNNNMLKNSNSTADLGLSAKKIYMPHFATIDHHRNSNASQQEKSKAQTLNFKER